MIRLNDSAWNASSARLTLTWARDRILPFISHSFSGGTNPMLSHKPRSRNIVVRLYGWSPAASDSLRDTAWLDGVRGVAAALVMLNHYNYEWLSAFAAAPFGAVVKENRNPDMVWYYQKDDRLWDFWRLPIIRLFITSGDAQVSIFFVLSGLVLSWGPLRYIHQGDYDKAARSLGSASFRRWIRLFPPCIAVSTLYMVQHIARDYKGLRSIPEELWKWIEASEQWANPFTMDHVEPGSGYNAYSFVMWTVPFEYTGSLFVFLLLLSIGRANSYSRRVLIVACISLYSLLSLYWCFWMFSSGLLIADYVLHAGGFQRLPNKTSSIPCLLWTGVLLAALLLLGTPSSSTWYYSTGYEWLHNTPLPRGFEEHVGEGRFFWGIGAILFIMSASHLVSVRRFFELPLMQYLGRVSFMLYLIHWLILDTLGSVARRGLHTLFYKKEFSATYRSDVYTTGPFSTITIFLLLWLLCAPVALLTAHWLEVLVDRPCTIFSRYLDSMFLGGCSKNDIDFPAIGDMQHIGHSRSEEAAEPLLPVSACPAPAV